MTDREKFEEYFTAVAHSMKNHGLSDFEILHRKDQQWNGWKAALASEQPVQHGWIQWTGGGSYDDWPTESGEVIVDVLKRNDRIFKGMRARVHHWDHLQSASDIIAYLVVTGENK